MVRFLSCEKGPVEVAGDFPQRRLTIGDRGARREERQDGLAGAEDMAGMRDVRKRHLK